MPLVAAPAVGTVVMPLVDVGPTGVLVAEPEPEPPLPPLPPWPPLPPPLDRVPLVPTVVVLPEPVPVLKVAGAVTLDDLVTTVVMVVLTRVEVEQVELAEAVVVVGLLELELATEMVDVGLLELELAVKLGLQTELGREDGPLLA
jgi:hypothetical protein